MSAFTPTVPITGSEITAAQSATVFTGLGNEPGAADSCVTNTYFVQRTDHSLTLKSNQESIAVWRGNQGSLCKLESNVRRLIIGPK